ncbi:hypothetical protein K0M31_016906 [Melipona bicolor]|uniref:G-patch domain-containing protein n=1 Tax=Melipona bicolor TaxID=60889 RepID=A0AA40KEB7_9HYME|nr:hypothetical protein K0M31_016906 [Melipona bicolor]
MCDTMLAQPRRKQKWTLLPYVEGKKWSEDSNKYGQRMLEKMGWTSGKGLGVNEQGITKHIHLPLKDDTTGFGYKESVLDEAWIEHPVNFNDFLQKLQENKNYNVVQTKENKNALSEKSLELKSKQSRTRVHYQKFTKQKDVNKYSSKDLANIFGQKELNMNKNSKNKEDNSNKNSDSVGTHDVVNGVITINGGNMTEYFMKKSQNFPLASKYKTQEERNIEKESEYAEFGFASTFKKVNSHDNEEIREIKSTCNYAFENPCVELNSPKNISDFNKESEFSKKRKSDNELHLNNKIKKFKYDSINENSYANGIVNAGLNLDCEANEIYNGEEFEVSRVQFGLTNSALDLSDEINDKKRVTFNDHVEYSTDCVKKKKNRITLDKFEVENKKAKKKKKHNSTANNPISSGCINEALDVETNEEIHDNEVNEHKSKKSKKRKKSRRSNLETIVETSEEEKTCENETEIKETKMEDNVPSNNVSQDVSNSKKKKKKNKYKNKIQDATENKYDKKNIEKETVLNTNEMLEEEKCKIAEDQENIYKTKRKKKKTKIRDTESEFKKNEDVISVTETEVKNDVGNVVMEKIKLEAVKVEKKAKEDDTVNDVSSESTNVKDEKEVSDKENTKDMEKNEINKPEKKEYKKLVNKSINYSTHNMKFTKQGNKVFTNTYLKNFNDKKPNTLSSPWNERVRMSKKILTSLFHRKSVLDFPGSNVHEIKGYGIDLHQNLKKL